MMFWYGSHLAFWQVTLMWVGMIVFWVIVVWALYALISSATRGPEHEDPGRDARRILDQRLANGEIDVEDYQRVREAIGAGLRTPKDTGARR
ncbi:MAG: SHOCT domain-containing protein [Acidimicrobiales bacterium]